MTKKSPSRLRRELDLDKSAKVSNDSYKSFTIDKARGRIDMDISGAQAYVALIERDAGTSISLKAESREAFLHLVLGFMRASYVVSSEQNEKPLMALLSAAIKTMCDDLYPDIFRKSEELPSQEISDKPTEH